VVGLFVVPLAMLAIMMVVYQSDAQCGTRAIPAAARVVASALPGDRPLPVRADPRQ
jgi:hypothetical protein